MIFSQTLRFACDTCVSGHRARDCIHYNRIQDGIVHMIKNRGRPSKLLKDTQADSEKVKLLAANPDPERNLKCPNSGKYCFECPPRCCSKRQLKNSVYVQDEGMILETVKKEEAPKKVSPKETGWSYQGSSDYTSQSSEVDHEYEYQYSMDGTPPILRYPHDSSVVDSRRYVNYFEDQTPHATQYNEREDDQESIITIGNGEEVDEVEEESSDDDDDDSSSSSDEEDVDDLVMIQRQAAANRLLQQQRVQQLQYLSNSSIQPNNSFDQSQPQIAQQPFQYQNSIPIEEDTQQPLYQVLSRDENIENHVEENVNEINLSESIPEIPTESPAPQENHFLSMMNSYGLSSDLYDHYRESYREYENSFPEIDGQIPSGPAGNYLFGGQEYNEPATIAPAIIFSAPAMISEPLQESQNNKYDSLPTFEDLSEQEIDILVASVVANAINESQPSNVHLTNEIDIIGDIERHLHKNCDSSHPKPNKDTSQSNTANSLAGWGNHIDVIGNKFESF